MHGLLALPCAACSHHDKRSFTFCFVAGHGLQEGQSERQDRNGTKANLSWFAKGQSHGLYPSVAAVVGAVAAVVVAVRMYSSQ